MTNVANEMVTTVISRLNVMPDVAYLKYVNKASVDEPGLEKEETAAFLKQAKGVPTRIAVSIIGGQIAAGKAVQRSLILQWSTGVAPLPTGPPKSGNELGEAVNDADLFLARAVSKLALAGVPHDWPTLISAAGDDHLHTLDQAVPEKAMNQALAPIAAWPPNSRTRARFR